MIPTLDLARKLIAEQFPEYASLPITDVEKQGHDNRDPTAVAGALIKWYAKRWGIEPQFRDTKDLHFGMGLSETSISHNTTHQTDDTIISKVVGDTLATNTSSIETFERFWLLCKILSCP
jgi:hypothetical protein